MNDNRKTHLGWALVITPIPLMFFTLSAYAIVSFIAASTASAGISENSEKILVIFNFLLSFSGLISILGIILGIPFGIFLLLSRGPKELENVAATQTVAAHEYRDASSMAKTTIGLLTAFIVLAAIDSLRIGATLGSFLFSDARSSKLPNLEIITESSMSLLVLLMFLVAGVAVLRWKFYSYRNARIQSPGLRHAHGWAIGGYFVPFANFFLPYNIMRDMAATHRAEKASKLLLIWWLSFLVAQLASQLIPHGDIQTAMGAKFFIGGNLLWSVGLVISAIALILIIQDISTNQQKDFAKHPDQKLNG